MGTTYKKVELAANLAIIVVALTLTTVVVKRYLLPDTQKNVPASQSHISIGDKLSIANVDWQTSDNTLVLVLQKGCRYCDESAAFYRRLIKGLDGRSDVRLLAVLPQDAGEAKEYLNDLGVTVSEIVQSPPSAFGVRGTPTLMLVNHNGEVQGIWQGKLTGEQESKVSERLHLTLAAAF